MLYLVFKHGCYKIVNIRKTFPERKLTFSCCFVCQETVDELQTKVAQSLRPNHSSVVSRGHLEADNEGVSEQLFNLSVIVTKLTDDVERHSKNLAELVCFNFAMCTYSYIRKSKRTFFCVNLLQMLEVVQINTTVFNYQHKDAISEKPTPCNCSAEVGNLWEQLSSNKLSIESVKQDLQALQKPVTTLQSKDSMIKLRLDSHDITQFSVMGF